MAKSSSNKCGILVLSLALVILSMVLHVESAQFGIGFGNTGAVPRCVWPVGAESGDTCDSVAKTFHLTMEEFTSLNPNLNCDAIFVGQWLCIEGYA